VSVEDRVIALIDEGNPIPDPNDLDRDRLDAAAYLATLEPRSSEVTQVDTRSEDQIAKRTYWPWLAAAMVIVLVGLAVVLLNQSDDNPAADASPEEVLTDYAAVSNSGDVDGVIDFYTDDAVVENHPGDDDGIATGTAEIRALEEQLPAFQGSGDGIELIDMVVSGNTVTFNQMFFRRGAEADSSVIQGCIGHKDNQVTVEDGKITLYVWGPESEILCLDWVSSLAPDT
jgi:ketosteroid isomerase-like protein